MSSGYQSGLVWMDGRLVPWHSANAHILSHTIQHGSGVFEGVRAYETPAGTAIFRLQEHTSRLFRSARILQIDLPYDARMINEAICEVVRANEYRECYIRPLVYFGAEPLGICLRGNSVHVAIAAWPWSACLGTGAPHDGIRVKTSSFVRHHVNAVMIHAKATGHYLNSVLANQEALRDGYDEALMLDTQGYAAEGSTENLFIVREGALLTPETANVLEGITRNTIIALARDRCLSVTEKRITRDEIYCADEAFFTGTAAEVIPIRELDRRPIGTGRPGSITRALQEDFLATVRGRNRAHSQWLTPISAD
jgi:branched-chain amino acid aminotransferase